jgi:protein-tyrosine phosphatase
MTEKSALRLQGSPNFRDLGGYRGHGENTVKRHHLFRTGNFAHVTPEDVETLRRIPLRTVIDLRSAMEIQLYPSILPADLGIALVNAETNPYANAGAQEYKKILADDPTPRGALKTIAATYGLLPQACGPAIKVVVDCVINGGTPVAFHCSNGRDRTGVISMMLLYMLGVSREDIVANYVESNSRIDLEAAINLSRTVFIKEYGVEFDYETLRTMNQALAPNVDIAFATMDRLYGSAQGYLEAFGVTTQQQEALRNAMLERI